MKTGTLLAAFLICALMQCIASPASATVTEEDIPRLVRTLVEGGEQSEAAAKDLPQFHEKTVTALLDTIKKGHDNERVRSVLYQAMDKNSIVPVAGYINDRSDVVRNISRDLIRGTGDDAVPPMLDMMGKADTHEAAVDVLKTTAMSNTSVELLRGQLKSDNSMSRAGAVMLLGVHKDSVSEPEIVRLMDDADPKVREGAIAGYLNLHQDDPAGYDKAIVLAKLKDSEPGVRATAMEIAGNVYDESLRDTLIDMLESEKDHEVLTKVVVLLARKGEAVAVFPILKLFDEEDADYDFQTSVIWALGELRAKEAVPYLVKPFESGKPVNLDVRKDTFVALAKIGEPVDLGLFLKYVEEGETHENSTNEVLKMIEALARPGDKAVIDALEGFRGKASDRQGEIIDRTLERIK